MGTVEHLYRSAEGLGFRAAESGDGRTIEGIAVPYNVRQRITDDLTEMFIPGSFADQIRTAERGRASATAVPAYRMALTRNHESQGGTVIGRAVAMEERAEGLWVALRVSQTPAGDETLTLVRDGVLDELSIGFRVRQGWSRADTDGTVIRTRAEAFETAIVMRGAYGRGAVVAGVRSETEESYVDPDLVRRSLAEFQSHPAVLFADQNR